jgi:hypothetical protein
MITALHPGISCHAAGSGPAENQYQDVIQSAMLSCIPLGITAAMVKVLGIPLEIAVLMVSK